MFESQSEVWNLVPEMIVRATAYSMIQLWGTEDEVEKVGVDDRLKL
jgi:hypothetical protein